MSAGLGPWGWGRAGDSARDTGQCWGDSRGHAVGRCGSPASLPSQLLASPSTKLALWALTDQARGPRRSWGAMTAHLR